ncbi:MAG: putative ATPase, partial [Jatrophihabitantaceae bacterium]|nr:putative ATPase [Jatrophihabitantaceae bacterium]
VTGADRARRWAEAARRAAGSRFLVADVPATEAGWSALVREATLSGAGVIIELVDGLPVEGRRWIERAVHLSWALTTPDDLPIRSMPSVRWREHIATSEVASPQEWRDVVGAEPSKGHRLTADQLGLVGRVYAAVDGDVDAAVRRLLAGPLGQMARRVGPRKTWDDLILPAARLAQLRAIVDRYRFAGTVYDEWGVSSISGRGILALFTGPSGTGKTLAAEVVATALDLDMYKLDLSSVVSKYIGETEQNLDKVFDAASAGNAVLFFDEADALFGKRSEVKDGRDRYANLEVSYLLQRLEAYDGIVLMATNLPKNIDAAFLRRLHAVVDFALPAEPERRAIWARHLSGGMPLDAMDLDALAGRFEVSGGIIRNVVIAAAFRAAAEGVPVSMAALLQGVSEEYVKLGRIQKAGSFNV